MVVVWELRRHFRTQDRTIRLKIHHRACIETGCHYLPPPLRLSPRLHTWMKKSSRVGAQFRELEVFLQLA